MEREVRYCTTDDSVRIAYCVEGEGPPLLLTPWAVESFSLAHLVPDSQEHDRQLAREHQFIKYDRRGTGLSQRDVDDLSHHALVRDLEAVVRALGLSHFSLMAGFVGGPVAIEYAARHPRQVDRLVLYPTFARVQDVFSPEALAGFTNLARANWELASRTFYDLSVRRASEDAGLRYAEWVHRSTDGETVARLIECNADLDVTPVLAKVRCPTLVIQERKSPAAAVPAAAVQQLAAGIPNARVLLLDVESMYSDHRIMMATAEKVAAFLRGETAPLAGSEPAVVPAELPTSTAVILFADIVESTALTEALGDTAFREKARELDGSLRSIIREASGMPVEGKLLGDGVLAVFTSARQAIEAALRCGAAGEAGGLPLHLGIHAGDVIREGDNVYGGAVNIAARIAAASAPGEVLVSQTVRDLARTSAGVTFDDRGQRKLKGVEGRQRLYAVRAQE